MASVYTVGQINSYIRQMFAQDFLLSRVLVKGEISNCKYHTSGHIYFSLKDDVGVISCVMFAGSRKGLSFHLENGQKVVVTGAVSVYERDGTYQLYARAIKLDGLGELYERFEALKAELEEMGMFAPEYKQPLPKTVRTLGVVTAPTGAAVRDIIQIAKRRNPGIRIILYPAKVQGEGAAESIVHGIEMLDQTDCDVIIVGRGGGSIEDLWAFNEEIVARAVFSCQTPVISAVGHETDFTICDFVADVRASTPSAGAELAVADLSVAAMQLQRYRQQMDQQMQQKLSDAKARLEQKRLKLKLASPEQQLREKGRILVEKEDRLRQLMQQTIMDRKAAVLLYIEKLKGLSPLLKLEQGYACVLGENQKRIVSVSQVKEGDTLSIYLSDGKIRARAEQIEQGS